MYGVRMGFSLAGSLQDLDGSKLVQGAGGCQDNVYLRSPSLRGPTMVAMRTRAILLASALLLLPAAFAQNVPAITPSTGQESKPAFSMTDAEKADVAARVRTETLHAWEGYKKYAWGRFFALVVATCIKLALAHRSVLSDTSSTSSGSGESC